MFFIFEIINVCLLGIFITNLMTEITKLPKITTNLFSFATFRSPDKINPSDKMSYFIYYPGNITETLENYQLLNNNKSDGEQQYLDFLASLNPISNPKELRDLNIDFYDYSFLLIEQRKNDSSRKPLDIKPPKPLTDKVYLQIWNELFVQIATQQSTTVRQLCLQLIITQFYIQNLKRLKVEDVRKMAVVIPQVLIDLLKEQRYKRCGGELYGVKNLGILDYRRVEQTLCCYVPGEVSHIENVMMREYKEKSTRNLLRTEDTTELSSEIEREDVSDTTTAERNEISKEIARELQRDQSFNVSGSVTVNKGISDSFGLSANVTTGYNNNSSSAQSNTEAKNYAKEITERALKRIVQKTTEKRTFKMIKEFEESNKHGFDNRKGKTHVTGVYRWVDKIYDNELINYGKRLLLELEVPNPALLYKKAMKWEADKEDVLTPPKKLEDFDIKSYEDIDEERALEAATYYGIEINGFEEDNETFTIPFQNQVKHISSTVIDNQSPISIPSGLVAKSMTIYLSFQYKSTVNPGSHCTVKINGEDFKRGDFTHTGGKRSDDYTFVKNFNPKVSGAMSFSVSYRKVYKYEGTIIVTCVSDPAFYENWQQETYNQLQSAYQNKLDEYNEEIKQKEAEKQAKADQEKSENYSNEAVNRLIEERELKRSCVEMMSKPYCYEFGKRFYECKKYTCTTCEEDELEAITPEIVQNKELEKYSEFIKFFETAFEWEILSYEFFPYYYNEKCAWYELLQTNSSDPIFEAFLQSGMAKVLVPVRPQFERAVLWYMETGEIYPNTDLIPESIDDRYESLLKELGEQDEVTVEGKWQTRVPSTLTIIQEKSTYLEDEQGLPCYCDDESEMFKSDAERYLRGEDEEKEEGNNSN